MYRIFIYILYISNGASITTLLGVELFGVDTSGPWGPSAHRIFQDISKKNFDWSREQRAGLFFDQKISIAIQRDNASSVLGTFAIDRKVDYFFNVH